MSTEFSLLKDKFLCNNSNIKQKIELLKKKYNEGKILKYASENKSWISLYNPDEKSYYIFNPNSFGDNNRVIALKNNKTFLTICNQLKSQHGKNWIQNLPKLKSI